jgi:hypothetical protein
LFCIKVDGTEREIIKEIGVHAEEESQKVSKHKMSVSKIE